jgi:hypothetical protein
MIPAHVLTEEKDEVTKGKFYSSSEKSCNAVPSYDMEARLGYFNATWKRTLYVGHNRCSELNDNENKMVNF